MSEVKCTLSNDELIRKSNELVSKLCETGGHSWCLRVPVDLNNDPDIIFTELGNRVLSLSAQLSEVQKEAYPAYKREKALRCKAENELAEAQKENEELKTHAYAVAKDLRKRMNEQDALWQEAAQHLLERAEKAEAENAELKTEIERRNSKTWCAYCGFEIDIDDEASTKISEHIMSCPKHPIRIYERHSEALEAENAALRERLKKMEEAKEYKDHEFCKDVECTALEYNACNAYVCYKTAKHFHRWLEQNGYAIVKAIKAACEKGE